jgi:peptidoglycan/LPS O-acetylase OafA/YrhL
VVIDALIIVGIGLSVSRLGGAAGRWLAVGGGWLAALTGLLLLTINQANYPYPWSGYAILAFMFTGTLIYRADHGQVHKTEAAVVAIAVLTMTVAGAFWWGTRFPTWNLDTRWHYQYFTSLVGAALTFAVGLATRRWRIPRILSWFGMISYSVYMTHPLIINAYASIPALANGSKPMWLQVLLALAMLAAITGLAAVTYYLVEKPMQRLGRKVAQRYRDPASAAGPAASESMRAAS